MQIILLFFYLSFLPIITFSTASFQFESFFSRSTSSLLGTKVPYSILATEMKYEDFKPFEKLSRCYFADNDLIAAGAMKAIKKRGIRIPEDVSIIGFDNMPLCTYVEPSLSTINVPKQYMGQQAVHTMISFLFLPTLAFEKIHSLRFSAVLNFSPLAASCRF